MKHCRPAVLIALLSVAGCSSSSDTDMSQYVDLLKTAMKSSSGVTRRQAAEIPYASMGWRLNGGHESILVLATETGENQTWTSAAHIVLQTRNGHISRTVGLPHDLAGLTSQNGQSLVPPGRALEGPYSQQRIADFADLGAYNVLISCRGERKKPQPIAILGKLMRTIRVEEACESPSLHWSFTDTYWLDKDNGFVWRAIQHVHPKGDVLDFVIFRPPE